MTGETMRIQSNVLQNCFYTLLTFFIGLLLPLITFAQPGDDTPSGTMQGIPKIVYKNQIHDFGTVQPKTALTHEFLFENKGTSNLLIEKVKAG